jgi:hypothetical protein
MTKEMREDDVVLLYLAGHGKVSVGEEMFYFVPVDGRDADLHETRVSSAILADALRSLPALACGLAPVPAPGSPERSGQFLTPRRGAFAIVALP